MRPSLCKTGSGLHPLSHTGTSLSERSSTSQCHTSHCYLTPATVLVLNHDLSKINLLSTMSREDILNHMHHPDTILPEVHTKDTPTPLDKKTCYLAEELHCVIGYQKVKNYKQLIRATHEGHYVDVGKSPSSLGSYSTLRKSPCRKSNNHTKYCYLNKVHGNIGRFW